MARTASVSIGGYFPCPEHLLNPIKDLLEFDSSCLFLDPCAGEGRALVGISEGNSRKYGIEIEKTRFKALQDKIGEGYAYHGDAFTFKQDRLAMFSVLYLNPPYDLDPITGRLEEKFLQRWVTSLYAGGVLLFLVPFYALEASAETLAKHFDKLQVFRFPDKDFAVFKQVILVGTKRPALDFAPEGIVNQIKAWSKDVSSCPVLGETSEKIPVLSPSAWHGYPSFTRVPVDLDAVSREYKPWSTVDRRGRFVPVSNVPTAINIDHVLKKTYPLAMPPRVAHIAMAVASGIFNGSLVTPDDPSSTLPPLLVKGVFDKKWKEVGEKKDKEGEVVGYKQEQRPELVITVFDTKWQEFHTLPAANAPSTPPPDRVSTMNSADLLTLYGKSLMRVMMQQCPVLHDPANDTDRFPLVEMNRPMYPAQEEAVRANIKLLGGPTNALKLRGKYAFLLGELGSGKSFGALATSVGIGAKRTLIVCPPHLLAEWENEVKKFCPGGQTTILSDVHTLDKWADTPVPEGVRSFGLLSRESAKLGHGWIGVDKCPKCHTPVPPGVDVAKKRSVCGHKHKIPGNSTSQQAQQLARDLFSLVRPGSVASSVLGLRVTPKTRREVSEKDKDRLCSFLDGTLRRFFNLENVSIDQLLGLYEISLAAIGRPDFTSQTILDLYGFSLKKDKNTWGTWQKVRDFCREQVFTILDGSARGQIIQGMKELGTETGSGYTYSASPWNYVDDTHASLCDFPQDRSIRPKKFPVNNEGKLFTFSFEHGSTETFLSALDRIVSACPWKDSEPCGERLYQAVAKPRRYPLANYIIRRKRDCYDFLVVDECQEYSTSSGSAQEKAIHRLTEIGKPTLLMTGTGMNGYASSLFSNLWACNREFRNEFNKEEEQAFVDRYGYRTRLVEEKERKEGTVDYGSNTDREMSARITGVAPGVLPLLILKWILPWATTLHKTDLEETIPELSQEKVVVTPTPELLEESKRLATKLVEQIRKDQFDEEKSGKLFGAMAQLPSYLDLCTVDTGNQGNGLYEIRYPESVGGGLVETGKVESASTILPKEKWMIDKIREELNAGHHVMVWAWHRQLLPRYQRILEGYLKEKVVLLDPSKVPAKKRRAWIDKEVVAKGVRVMVVNPMAIQTGLNNLVSFSRVIVMENPACNPIIYRQAVGRIDRIGQKKETKVYFPVYEGSLQEQAHKLLFTKVAVSQVVDGMDATSTMEASGMGDIEALASMSIGKALAEMYLNDL